MYKKFADKIYRLYDIASTKKEDAVVLDFFDALPAPGAALDYLEVGSGLGRFALLVKEHYQNFNIRCLEKNDDLVAWGRQRGLAVVSGDVTKMDFADQEFDIVQCSHVIEHISYPAILKALDELIRVTKIGGYIIIRSPLLSPDFFTSIDHIRPYPPSCILDFYSNPQQQVTGKASIKVVKEKFRREALVPFPYPNSVGARGVNLLMKLFWTYLRFPSAKPNGYVLILQKQ